MGKREVERGRVRSYVVERPAEAQVRLHEERVQVERRPVDRPLAEADRVAAFQDRTLEATARSEEAVVGKEARVVEEIAVRKEAADRVGAVRDTVRRTEVEVDDGSARAVDAAVDKDGGDQHRQRRSQAQVAAQPSAAPGRARGFPAVAGLSPLGKQEQGRRCSAPMRAGRSTPPQQRMKRTSCAEPF